MIHKTWQMSSGRYDFKTESCVVKASWPFYVQVLFAAETINNVRLFEMVATGWVVRILPKWLELLGMIESN